MAQTMKFPEYIDAEERTPARVFERAGFKLAIWDDGWSAFYGPENRTLAYRLWQDGKLIFEGNDYGPGAGMATDSDESIAGLLGFLSLKPGDTDREYFDNYTPEQLEWADMYADDLSLLVHDLEREIKMRQLVEELAKLNYDGEALPGGGTFDMPGDGAASTLSHFIIKARRIEED